jgi:hypothetical protein
MSYFDQNKPTEIIVDASPVGLAAILVQAGKLSATPVALYLTSKVITCRRNAKC